MLLHCKLLRKLVLTTPSSVAEVVNGACECNWNQWGGGTWSTTSSKPIAEARLQKILRRVEGGRSRMEQGIYDF